jgi:hypothetical protein
VNRMISTQYSGKRPGCRSVDLLTVSDHARAFGQSPCRFGGRVMTTAAPPKFVSLANGAQLMGVSVDTLRRRIRTGDLLAVRDGCQTHPRAGRRPRRLVPPRPHVLDDADPARVVTRNLTNRSGRVVVAERGEVGRHVRAHPEITQSGRNVDKRRVA